MPSPDQEKRAREEQQRRERERQQERDRDPNRDQKRANPSQDPRGTRPTDRPDRP